VPIKKPGELSRKRDRPTVTDIKIPENKEIVVDLASLVSMPHDPRPHAKVLIFGKPLVGLLDRGTTCTILGKNCEKFLANTKIKLKESFTVIVLIRLGRWN
jgi:hypothetical protein